MTMRTSSRSVTFTRSFRLKGLDGEHPAGSYQVETDEELIEELSIPAYRRVATWFRVPRVPDKPGIAETVSIDPDDLTAALARDLAPGNA